MNFSIVLIVFLKKIFLNYMSTKIPEKRDPAMRSMKIRASEYEPHIEEKMRPLSPTHSDIAFKMPQKRGNYTLGE